MSVTEIFRGFTTPRRAAATDHEVRMLSSATQLSLEREDGKLAGWSWGKPGPRVLLVHGWDSRASHLGRFIEPLCRRGFQVWAFDGPAHGESGGTSSSVVHYGRALLDIASQFGPFDGVIAHSVGSPAALYAFRHGMRVKSSVHIAGPSSLERVIQRLAQATGIDALETAQLRTLYEEHIGGPVSGMDLEELAPSLTHSGLIVHDPADREIPFEESERLRDAWPSARLIPVQGVGHRRIILQIEVVNAAVEHLVTTIPPMSASLANNPLARSAA